jgi:hypothetical protein
VRTNLVEKVPDFSAIAEILKKGPIFPEGDPPYPLFALLDKAQLLRLVQLEINYKINVANANLEFNRGLLKITEEVAPR